MQPNYLTVITGGSRGIGHHLVEAFLRDGDVLNISRGPAEVEERFGHELHNLSLDLRDLQRIETALTAWLRERPDLMVRTLIHNAATLQLGRLHEVSATQIADAFSVNVQAPLVLTSTILRSGRFARAGVRIAYVVSSLGRPIGELTFAEIGLYSATKAALGRAAMVQRREFQLDAPHIEVIRIHPGIVDTAIQSELRCHPALDPAFAAKTAALPPYEDGDWAGRAPKDHMRTVPARFAAEFIEWAVRSPAVHADEYDLYHEEEFHAVRAS